MPTNENAYSYLKSGRHSEAWDGSEKRDWKAAETRQQQWDLLNEKVISDPSAFRSSQKDCMQVYQAIMTRYWMGEPSPMYDHIGFKDGLVEVRELVKHAGGLCFLSERGLELHVMFWKLWPRGWREFHGGLMERYAIYAEKCVRFREPGLNEEELSRSLSVTMLPSKRCSTLQSASH